MREGKVIIIILILSFSILVGCDKAAIEYKESVIPVKTITAIPIKMEETLDYVGMVQQDSTVKYGFNISGRIEEIKVNPEDIVKEGDLIASLNNEDYKYALDESKSQMEAAKAQYDKALNGAEKEDIENARLNVQKAQDGYDYAKEQYDKIEKLYNADAASKGELDAVKLQLDISESELNQAKKLLEQVENGTRNEDVRAAKAQYDLAKTNYEYTKKQFNDTKLYADSEYIVISTLAEEGEMLSAGYPVVILRSLNQKIVFGVTDEELPMIEKDMPVKVISDNNKHKGKITLISRSPNQDNWTYAVECTLVEESEISLGSVVDVNIILGEENGMWIPIDAIISKGEDIVYVVENDKALKRNVTLEETKGYLVKVKGLKEGDKVITENISNINHGDHVSIVK